MKREFPELESLSKIKVNKKWNSSVAVVVIKDKQESLIDVGGLQRNEFCVDDVTNTCDGNIVITFGSPGRYSHITVINRDGRIQQQCKIRNINGHDKYLYCSRLAEFKVATIAPPCQVFMTFVMVHTTQ